MPSNRSHTERALRFVAIKYNGSHVTYLIEGCMHLNHQGMQCVMV